MSTLHSKAAKEFNKDAEKTTWHDQTFWALRTKRDDMARDLPEWEDLREHASEIKKHTLSPFS
jgi:L-lactate dehydrogenase complex protein LldF